MNSTLFSNKARFLRESARFIWNPYYKCIWLADWIVCGHWLQFLPCVWFGSTHNKHNLNLKTTRILTPSSHIIKRDWVVMSVIALNILQAHLELCRCNALWKLKVTFLQENLLKSLSKVILSQVEALFRFVIALKLKRSNFFSLKIKNKNNKSSLKVLSNITYNMENSRFRSASNFFLEVKCSFHGL